MRILVIKAGTNDPSNSSYLADEFVNGIRLFENKTEIDIARLKDLHINHFTLENYKENCMEEGDFLNIKKLILSSDAVVISSPIWNFSVPAHLKNLIDRIGSFALDSAERSKGTLGGKPFYLIFTGGSSMAILKTIMKRTVSSVPQSIRYFGGSVSGMHFEPRCAVKKGVFGLVVDKRPKSIAMIRRKGAKFAAVVEYFSKNSKLPPSGNFWRKCYEFGRAVYQSTVK